jgi:hypothetical protein
MGKTSVAQALVTRCDLGQDSRLVYLSLDGVVGRGEAAVLRAIAERLWLRAEVNTPQPVPAAFTRPKARLAFERFLTQLGKERGERRVVLVLDEFDVLNWRLGPEGGDRLLGYLRAQAQDHHWLALALVGLSDLDDLAHSYAHPLLGWADIPVGFLEREWVADVLSNPPNAPDFPLSYDHEAIDEVVRLTGGQPYLVQVLGHLLVRRYNRLVFVERRPHPGVFRAADVAAVVQDPGFFKTAAAYFEGVWGQAAGGQPGETRLLLALASDPDGLAASRLPQEAELPEAVADAVLDALVRHALVAVSEDRVQFKVQLMQRWTRETKGPGGTDPSAGQEVAP